MEKRRGRLEPELLERMVVLTCRVLRLAEKLEADRRPARIVDQLIGAGSSPGAQVHEADAAMSPRDFVKSLAIATKELSECRYWLSVITRMNWVEPDKLAPLFDELDQVASIAHTIIKRTRNPR